MKATELVKQPLKVRNEILKLQSTLFNIQEFISSDSRPNDNTCDCKHQKDANYRCYNCGVKNTKNKISEIIKVMSENKKKKAQV